MHPDIYRNSPECDLEVGVGYAAHDLQSHTPHFVVSLMTNWSISEDKPPTEARTEGNFCSSYHVAMTAGSTTQDYEAGTVRGRVTASTSALVLIDSTRWKATRTGSLKSPSPSQWIINWFLDFKSICELNATRTGHSRPQPLASFLELLIYMVKQNMPSSGIK